MIYLCLIIGFVLLVKGADCIVDGSCSLARCLKIPSVLIGLTIVAMGTSAPELAVSLYSSWIGQYDMTIGNIIGSNIFNVLVVLGICALKNRVHVTRNFYQRDFIWHLLSTFILIWMMIDLEITKVEGFVLFVLMIIYLIILFKGNDKIQDNYRQLSMKLTCLLLVFGITSLIVGGRLVVYSAMDIAYAMGLSKHFIALTVVAIGTSLPEVVTSFVAIKKGYDDLALSNVVGSNIFNILLIVSLSSIIQPLSLTYESIVDGWVAFLIAVSLLLTKRKQEISKGQGIMMLIGYSIYLVYIIIR